MSNTRQARYLEALLEQRAGKRLAVMWDQPVAGGPWRWHVDWADGPTLEQMRAWVDDVADDVAPMDITSLSFSRRFSLIAWSVQLVRYLVGGGTLEDTHAALYLIEEAMGTINAPDRAGDQLEDRRAKALRRLVMRRGRQGGEHVVTFGDEVAMLATLKECGLEVLDLDAALDDLEG